MTKHQIEELMESQERIALAMDAGNLCSWEINLQNFLRRHGMLIYQLFYNLIYNALKFSKENCPSRIGIDAAYETDGMREWVVVQVADNGIGIDNEYREKIFESFVRLNAKSEYEGTGLGLSLCRKIVLRHKGTITASGVNGTGSVFTVRMPVKQNWHSAT